MDNINLNNLIIEVKESISLFMFNNNNYSVDDIKLINEISNYLQNINKNDR